jgi:integrase
VFPFCSHLQAPDPAGSGNLIDRAGRSQRWENRRRHTAVSIMSSNGVPIQDISDTVGHKSTHVTETVYRTSSGPPSGAAPR